MVEVLLGDRALFQQRHLQEIKQWPPVIDTDKDQRKLADLSRLDQRHCLEGFVHCPEPARKNQEGLGILDQHHLSHEKVLKHDDLVEVRICILLDRQNDVAADRLSTGIPCAAICRLHDSGTATRHDRETKPRHG